MRYSIAVNMIVPWDRLSRMLIWMAEIALRTFLQDMWSERGAMVMRPCDK